MRKTTQFNNENPLLVNTAELMSYLNCGKFTANKIGTDAKARVQYGRLVMWNLGKVKNYLDNIATE